jgi:hypothetical protein
MPIAAAWLVIGLLAVPAGADAATRYVDFDTGDDMSGVNDCLTIGAPCKSIALALAVSGTGDTIEVDDDTYANSNMTVDSGKTLTGVNFVPADTGAAIVDPGNDANPVIIASGGATVSNLTVRNDTARLVEVAGPATITGNTFDEENTGAPTPNLLILSGAASPTVTGNHFQKASAGGTAIRNLSIASPTISSNVINHYNGGIDIQAGTPQLLGNEVVNETGAGTCDPCAAILVEEAVATITGNHLHDPVTSSAIVVGIVDLSGSVATGATLSRNLIQGGGTSLRVAQLGGTISAVTMSDDALIDYQTRGLLVDNIAPGVVSATNLTIASSQPGITADVAVNHSNLTLDSSIVSNAGVTATNGATCTISFSRGPVASPGGSGCSDFQTTANPLLTGATDPHLLAGSPMIDAGNPAAPSMGSVDLDGDARSLDGTPDCTLAPRRDIGADEFVGPGLVDCTAPDTSVSGKAKVRTRKKKARVTWTFTASEPGASFACSLDGAPFAPCTSPFSAKLRRGARTLSVRAADPAGNVDPSPASFTTKVKRKRVRR